MQRLRALLKSTESDISFLFGKLFPQMGCQKSEVEAHYRRKRRGEHSMTHDKTIEYPVRHGVIIPVVDMPKGRPHCVKDGAMNSLGNGLWRCLECHIGYDEKRELSTS
jgi:hypothetical protein